LCVNQGRCTVELESKGRPEIPGEGLQYPCCPERHLQFTHCPMGSSFLIFRVSVERRSWKQFRLVFKKEVKSFSGFRQTEPPPSPSSYKCSNSPPTSPGDPIFRHALLHCARLVSIRAPLAFTSVLDDICATILSLQCDHSKQSMRK